ncbi:OmpA-OmpF porin, OOP family [Aliiroseovarius sediminilitoris]|uniref:OmpA-OmpF porin, OOP family n=1 Tax=Aliiroseovarius sediminilitoris TaxID=1173584 RepID=A0A1I0QVZ6_9RHOB|nr:OmpA family protein [Aliiroseovarius sediminilitoris]SEW31604.1 OmpA-OmpF porin, OOP family [Aliiroseovarius sediminilitoris]
MTILSRFLWLATVLMFATGAAQPVQAFNLPAGAKLRAEERDDAGRATIATERFNGEAVPSIVAEGQIVRQAWKVDGTSQTSFQILLGLRDQLIQDGFDILFQCQSVSCGGYDFRFGVGHFKAPDMFVDLGDYHYLSARKEGQLTSVLVSRSKEAAFIEVLQLNPEDSAASKAPAISAQTAVRIPSSGPIGALLENNGRTVLDGLSFATGSSELTDGNVPVLNELATYLNRNPEREIILVGHTDAEGSLAGNVTLSRKRATAVMNSLIQQYEVNPAQLSAEGVGFLMPLTPNLTAEGREMNRRVEAVLISTD